MIAGAGAVAIIYYSLHFLEDKPAIFFSMAFVLLSVMVGHLIERK